MTDSTEAAARHWNSRFQAEASSSQRAGYYAMASPLYQRCYMNAFFGEGGGDWVSWVKSVIAVDAPLRKCLALGCGLGDGLVDFVRRGIVGKIHGIDIAEEAIEHGRRYAQAQGFGSSVSFSVGDFNAVELEPDAYDCIIMVMSLHHSLDVKGTVERVRRALRPGGFFVANEYIGPNRWQYTNAQLAIIKVLLTLLPKDLRKKPSGELKGRLGRPTIEWMLRTDPSEAAYSEEIAAEIQRQLSMVRRVDYGGAIAVPVLDEIIDNFSEERPVSMRWFRLVTGLDRLVLRWRLVPSANAVLIAKRAEG